MTTYPCFNLLEQLSPGEIDWILEHSNLETVLSRETLVREGESNDQIYFVADGVFDVYLSDAAGREQRVTQCGRGAVIGDTSWLDGRPTPATIRAAQSGAVHSLATAVLDRKVSEDPAFASRFFHGVARVASARVRAIAAQTRDAGQSTVAATDAGEGVQVRLIESLSQFKSLLASADRRALDSNGVIPKEYDEQIHHGFSDLCLGLNDAFRSDGGLPESSEEALGSLMQREMLPYIQLTETAERFYSKPRGYAGDYHTIEMIYENQPGGVGRVGPLLDACFLAEPAARAVRNRRGLLTEEILAACARHPDRETHVASLACGPAREVFDAFAALGDPARLRVYAVDIDREALELVGQRAREAGLERSLTTHAGNLIHLAVGKAKIDLPPQDLVYSIGLIDYFSDPFVVKLLGWIYDRLAPGGRVMLGNFHPSNPDKAFMDHVLDWRLVHRDEDDMSRLFARSKFQAPATRVRFEAEGVNLFAECAKA